jgi:hypothetical protein
MHPLHPLLLCAGATLLALVAALARRDARARRRWQRLVVGTARSPIAGAAGGGLTKIRGRVLSDGVLTAPFSGRRAVWVRARVIESGKRGRTIVDETESSPFFVDDRSGELAQVVPDGAQVLVRAETLADSDRSRACRLA